MLFNRLVASAADVNGVRDRDRQPTFRRGRRSLDHPTGGDHVVERQLVGDRRHGTDDVGIGGRHHRDACRCRPRPSSCRRDTSTWHAASTSAHAHTASNRRITVVIMIGPASPAVARTASTTRRPTGCPRADIAHEFGRDDQTSSGGGSSLHRPAASDSRWPWWRARPTTVARSPRRAVNVKRCLPGLSGSSSVSTTMISPAENSL